MKDRDLLRAPAAAAVGGGRRGSADPGRARADASSPTRSASTTCGRSSTTSSRSTATRARPRCSSPRCRSARSASGSVTASCRRRRRSTIPARVAERIAMLDLVSDGRVDFGTGESSSEAELGGFLIDPDGEARDVGGGPARRAAVHDRDAVHRATPARTSRCRRATSCPKPVQKPHPPVWVACSRRETIHLAAQKGIGALAFAFIDPEEARHWVTDYYDDAGGGGRADRRRGQPERRVRHHVHVPRGRETRDRARARGRQLLRVLARALLRVRPAPARASPTCGPSTEQRRAEQGFEPEAVEAAATEGERLGAQDRAAGGLRRAARRGRHARPDPRLPAALRGGGRRPGDLLQPGGQEPPRAHHGEPRAVRPRGAARVHRARRAGATRQGAAARAGARGGDGAQAGVGSPAAAGRRLRVPGDAARSRAPRACRTACVG